MINPVA